MFSIDYSLAPRGHYFTYKINQSDRSILININYRYRKGERFRHRAASTDELAHRLEKIRIELSKGEGKEIDNTYTNPINYAYGEFVLRPSMGDDWLAHGREQVFILLTLELLVRLS